MYKFTNGVVVYDEITRDKYISAGMILVKEDPKIEKEEEKVVEELLGQVEHKKFKPTDRRTGKFGRNFK